MFVEDRRRASARLDDGKVEELRVGPRAGARASASCAARPPASRTPPTSREAGLRDRGRRGRGRGAGRGGRDPRRGARAARDPPGTHEVLLLPETVAKARKVEVLERADARRPRGERRDPPGQRVATPTAGAGSSSPTPTACWRRTTRSARASGSTASRSGDTGMQTGMRGARAHARLRDLRRDRPGGGRAHRGRARPRPCCGPGRRRAGKLPVVLRRGAGGVLFHEACGHGLEADLVDKDASVFRGHVGELVAVAAGHAGRRRHLRARVGHLRDRRRGRARAAQRAHRERRAHRLHVGPRAGPQARSREQRQRPARDVPAPADGAHDQHVPARGRRRPRRHHPQTPSTASTASRSAAVR